MSTLVGPVSFSESDWVKNWPCASVFFFFTLKFVDRKVPNHQCNANDMQNSFGWKKNKDANKNFIRLIAKKLYILDTHTVMFKPFKENEIVLRNHTNTQPFFNFDTEWQKFFLYMDIHAGNNCTLIWTCKPTLRNTESTVSVKNDVTGALWHYTESSSHNGARCKPPA